MADKALCLYGPALITTAGTPSTLYTVPAATTTILRYLRIANISATTGYRAAVSIGPDSPAARLFGYPLIAADSIYEWTGFVPLASAQVIEAIAEAASQISVLVAGLEVT